EGFWIRFTGGTTGCGSGSGAGGGRLLTVTATADEVVLRPVLLVATAVNVCGPLMLAVVSQSTLYGAVVSAVPRLVLSILNCPDVTGQPPPAVAATVCAPLTSAPLAGVVSDTVGGVGLLTVTVTAVAVAVRLLRFVATAVSVCGPLPTVLVSHSVVN